MRTLRRASAVLLVLWSLSFSLHVLASAQSNALTELKGQLICQCGCNLVLASCQDMMECTVAAGMVQEISEKLSNGLSSSEIVQSFIARYGKPVLAAPTTRGFDLTAWVTPFLAVVVGLVVLYFVLRQFVEYGRRKLMHEAAGLQLEGKAAERFRAQLEEDLKDFV